MLDMRGHTCNYTIYNQYLSFIEILHQSGRETTRFVTGTGEFGCVPWCTSHELGYTPETGYTPDE
jgi:hypothetical protein